MLLQLFWIFSPLLVTGLSSEDDLEIVGSDNHYAYEPKIVDDEGAGEVGRYYRGNDNFNKEDFIRDEDIPKIDFPVKTVQRFTDADGNVKIVTSYSNRDDNPLPIYKDVALRQKGLQQARSSKPVEEQPANSKPVPKVAPSFITTAVPYAAQIEQRSRPNKQEYSATKTVRLPNQDGQLFANQHETSSSDGSSSSYNQKSSYKTNYKKPPLKFTKDPKVVEKTGYAGVIKKGDKGVNSTPVINNTPLEEAGSSYVSDIDESGVVDDEPSFDGGGYGGGEGYSEGSSSYSSGGSHVGGSTGPQIFEQVDEGEYDGDVESHGGGGGGGAGHYDGGGVHHHGGGGGAHHHGHSHGQSFKKGHGASHHHGDKGAKGDKGGKGFKKHEEYEKGHAESHGHEAEKGGKKEETGGKSGHLDEGNQYGKGHTESHGKHGNEKGHSKGHKKGHKTKGFRTVHHKDEYKKDEVFYDDEHDAGYQKGHGQDHHSNKHAKGGSHKKGHLDSGYKHAKKGFQGDKEKGHSYKNAKGHAGSSGGKQHHSEHSHFDKGAGHKEGEAHGFEHQSKGH